MIDTDKLRGMIAQRKLSQSKVAKMIGITPKTFYNKMTSGVFRSDERSAMIEILKIEKPADIFFAQSVTQQVTKSKEKGA